MDFDKHPPDPWHYLVGGVPEKVDMTTDDEPVEMAFMPAQLVSFQALKTRFIERTHNVLTREEALAHVEECREAVLK